VAERTDDTRRAPAAFVFSGPDGTARGEGEARIDDDALTVGPHAVAFLDADTLSAADYRITLGLWPAGTLELSALGRRYDTFVARLRAARDQARIAGLLAHGVAMPDVFAGALLEADRVDPADFHVYDTHVTVVPRDADPFQVPLGALTDLVAGDDPPAASLVTAEGRTVAGRLARLRDAFLAEVRARRDAQLRLLAELAGQAGFADGAGRERGSIRGFDALLTRFTAPNRVAGAAALLAAARGGEPRFGFARLLDPDGDDAQRPADLPDHWASFLLVPVGDRTAFEILAGPSAATYVFDLPVAEVNRDLQLLHFRRGALALTGADAEPAPGNPWRLALRRLAPLRRLREGTRARIVHNAGWHEAVARALG